MNDLLLKVLCLLVFHSKMLRKCCICFTIYNKKNKRRFFSFPEFTICDQKSSRDRVLIERRRNVWLQLTKRNLKTFSGRYFVCSDHFVSGKPAYLYLTEDVDWVPTLNLGYLGQDNQSLSTHPCGSSIDGSGSLQSECEPQQGLINSSTCNNYSNLSGVDQRNFSLANQSESPSVIDNGDRPKKLSTSDGAQISQERQRTALSNSNQVQDNVEQTPELEPLKRKAVYRRPIQPMNGIFPRVTATIISPESINIPTSINNLKACQNEPSVVVYSVSGKRQSVTVQKEITNISTTEEPDRDLHAAYCFTSKMTVERGTQVTADEIRQAFQSTAATQTLWK